MSDKNQPPGPLKLIGRASRGFTRLADVALRDHGFATGQMPVLGSLKGGGALSQAELARIAQVEQPSMAQLLNRMERDGLVERVPDPSDKRSRLIAGHVAAGRAGCIKVRRDLGTRCVASSTPRRRSVLPVAADPSRPPPRDHPDR